jgi:multidrug efflux system membrane fusion protein
VKGRASFRMIAALTIIVSCKHDETPAPQPARGGKGGGAGATFAVDVMPVEARTVDYVVQAPGSIDAFEHVQVTARVAGIVDKVQFSRGRTSRRGTAWWSSTPSASSSP